MTEIGGEGNLPRIKSVKVSVHLLLSSSPISWATPHAPLAFSQSIIYIQKQSAQLIYE